MDYQLTITPLLERARPRFDKKIIRGIQTAGLSYIAGGF
jgi:hypothetical protein